MENAAAPRGAAVAYLRQADLGRVVHAWAERYIASVYVSELPGLRFNLGTWGAPTFVGSESMATQ